MGLSIITPHYNNPEGLQKIYTLLKNQTSNNWEWVIVDDCSDAAHIKVIQDFFDTISSSKIHLHLNKEKTNASVCRNKGITLSNHETLVFLDSDDEIFPDFVANREVEIKDFTVFKNMNIINHKKEVIQSNSVASNYLEHFLNANFVWQTTAILWQKSFLNEIGRFNTKLKRLQDVELTIRALMKSENYKVLNNTIDFSYYVIPIRERKNLVQPVCDSVFYFVNHLLDQYSLSKTYKDLVKAYYYMCIKYLERSENTDNIVYVKPVLKLFYKKKYFSFLDYLLAKLFLTLYRFNVIAPQMFLKLNRYMFKSKVEH